jgi:hypothetical protein
MTIGPFSLMTTLLADPISAVYLASTGATADDEPAVALLDIALELSIRAVERSLRPSWMLVRSWPSCANRPSTRSTFRRGK